MQLSNTRKRLCGRSKGGATTFQNYINPNHQQFPHRSEQTKSYPERSEEPLGFSSEVSRLENELDGLLRVLSVGDFLESFRRDGSLETLEIECVSGRKEMVVVDRLSSTQFINSSFIPHISLVIRAKRCGTDLDERLDLGSLLNLLLSHSSSDFSGVTFDTSDDSMSIRTFLRSLVGLTITHTLPSALVPPSRQRKDPPNDNNLSSGESSRQHNGDLSWLVDCAHNLISPHPHSYAQ